MGFAIKVGGKFMGFAIKDVGIIRMDGRQNHMDFLSLDDALRKVQEKALEGKQTLQLYLLVLAEKENFFKVTSEILLEKGKIEEAKFDIRQGEFCQKAIEEGNRLLKEINECERKVDNPVKWDWVAITGVVTMGIVMVLFLIWGLLKVTGKI